ncbi:MAG: iron chaperone [Thermonemataceae bacterium]
MSGKVVFKNVNEYFEAQPENVRKALLELKECILKVAPQATELLNYNIPAYALVENGKREQQIMIAGYKKHVGLYPHPTTMEKFDSELSEYKRAKGSVQFPLDKPLPKNLIIRMIKYRIALLKK